MSSDLRAVLERVLDEPLVDPRPVEDVVRRGGRIVARRRRRRGLVRFAALVGVTTLGLQGVLDRSDDRVRVTGGPQPPVETTTTAVRPPVPFHTAITTDASPADAPVPSPPSPAAVRTPAAAAGEPLRCETRLGVPIEGVYAVRAAADRVNRAGGGCGRMVEVVVGDADLAVEPYGMPSAALARIVAEHAYRDLGARTFAVVHEPAHAAAADALAAYVATLPGASLRISRAVSDLARDTAAVGQACGSGCDAMLLAVAPATITAWLDAGGPTARRETAALPVAMDPKWPYDCMRDAGDRCREIAVWAPFRVPGASLDHPDLRQYEWDARSVGQHPQDARFLAWYVGAHRLLAGMRQTTFESTLVGPPDTAREFRIELDHGRFVGWRDVSADWHRDPG